MVEHPSPPPVVTMRLLSASPEETRRIAATLGSFCRGGETFLLYGDLGSGKTCFVQGLAAGLEVPPRLRVTSPTFTLHAEYPGRVILNHLDLYRLDDPGSLGGLGIGDMLTDTEAVTAVEWPEMLADEAGGDRLEIRFTDLGDGRRDLELSAYGASSSRLLAMLTVS